MRPAIARPQKLAQQLNAAGLDCYRILFPKGMDANEYALKVGPAAKSLGVAIRAAQWLGKGQARQGQAGAHHHGVRDAVLVTRGEARGERSDPQTHLTSHPSLLMYGFHL
jgi:hypothetical protein